MMSIEQLIEQRRSIVHYQSERAVSQSQVEQLIRLASLSPSAYNFQNWRFIAVQSDEARQQLYQHGYQQSQLLSAPLTVIVCGRMMAHLELQQSLAPSVEQKIIPQQVATSWLSMATNSHQDNPQLQRDEAIRSGSLAAMTLMLAAEGMGLASCAVGGFDAEAVSREFSLTAHELPVMLITLGYKQDNNWRQKQRKATESLLQWV